MILLYRHLQQGFHSLLIHRLRTFLNALGILFGVAALIAMLSIGEGAKQETQEQIERLGMTNLIIRQTDLSEEQKTQASERSSRGLTERDWQTFQINLPFLKNSAPLKRVTASVTGALAESSPEILALTRHYAEIKSLKLAQGRFICDLDQREKRWVCVLGYEVAKKLGKQGRVGSSLRLEKREYEIIGILKPLHWKENSHSLLSSLPLDKVIFIPLGCEEGLSRASQGSKEPFSEMILEIQNIRYMKEAARLVQAILEKTHGGYEDYQVIVPQELFEQASRTQRTFNWVLGSIAAISLVIGGIGMMNMMLLTLAERTREIGIRRAVGARPRDILIQFLVEILILTWIGSLLGIFSGIAFSWIISLFAGWKTVISLWSLFLAFSMASFVGLSAGLYPAWQAAKKDPIEAIRYV